MKYIPGREMASDYLTRNQLNQIYTDDTAEHFISMIVSDAVRKACTLKELINTTKSDETLLRVMKFVTSGHWSHDPRYHIYRQVQDQLSINNDLLLKHNCIAIPSAVQQQVLQLAHSQHQGISKTKALLREKVWWPAINRDVEQLINLVMNVDHNSFKMQVSATQDVRDPEVCMAHCFCRYTGTLSYRRIHSSSH